MKIFGLTRADFIIQWHQLLWFTPQFKAISECRQTNSLHRQFKTNIAAKLKLGAYNKKKKDKAKVCGYVCFELLVERISFVSNR